MSILTGDFELLNHLATAFSVLEISIWFKCLSSDIPAEKLGSVYSISIS